MCNLFHSLPIELTREIYDYDPTYKEKLDLSLNLIKHGMEECTCSGDIAAVKSPYFYGKIGNNICLKHDIIGLENLHHDQNGVVDFFKIYKNLSISKSNTILFGFNVHTNPLERQKALDVLSAHHLTVKIEKWHGPKGYLETLSKHKFVASPEGNGIDCHRTWEAIYLGVIPIVKRTVLSEYFYDLGLPILLISNWNEVDDFDAEYLSRFYAEHSDKFRSMYIWADAWLECFSSGVDPLSKIELERES